MRAEDEKAWFIRKSFEWDVVCNLDLALHVAGMAVKDDWSYRSYQGGGFRGDPFFRLYQVLSGEVELLTDAGRKTLTGGHFYLLPARRPFSYEKAWRLSHRWIHFGSELMMSMPHFQTILTMEDADYAASAAAMDRFIPLARKDSALSLPEKLRLDLTFREILLPFFAEVRETENRGALEQKSRFSKIIDHIDAHLNEVIMTEELAKLIGMEKNAFSKAFHAAFGIPPKQYLCLRRISRAQELLLTTRMGAAEIGRTVGYQNIFFFHRLFKKYTGLTPLEYRRDAYLG